MLLTQFSGILLEICTFLFHTSFEAYLEKKNLCLNMYLDFTYHNVFSQSVCYTKFQNKRYCFLWKKEKKTFLSLYNDVAAMNNYTTVFSWFGMTTKFPEIMSFYFIFGVLITVLTCPHFFLMLLEFITSSALHKVFNILTIFLASGNFWPVIITLFLS